jgi:hypothetical protein
MATNAAAEPRRPQHVIGEEDRQIQYHADHRGRDARQRSGEFQVAVRGFDQRRTEKNHDEAGQKREIGDHNARDNACSGQTVGAEQLFGPAAYKTDEGDHHDQRSRCRFAERKAVDHLRCAEPVILFDAALIDIRQYGVGATEREHCSLGKEPRHLRKRVFQAESHDQGHDRHQPEHEAA